MRHIQMLMNAATFAASGGASDRTAGFSDSWYDGSSEDQALSVKDKELMNLRAAMLPRTSSIVGARISLLDDLGRGKGRSRPYKSSLAGGMPSGATWAGNDPRAALKYTLYGSGTTNELNYYMQNVSNGLILNGSYNPSDVFKAKVKAYFDFVFENGYKFFGYNQALPKAPVVKIDIPADPTDKHATITLERNNTYNVGDFIRVIDSRTVLRGNFRGKPSGYHVSASAGLVLTVDNWDNGACKGGMVTKWDKILITPFIDDVALGSPLASVVKVGRPFFQYRGRASNRG